MHGLGGSSFRPSSRAPWRLGGCGVLAVALWVLAPGLARAEEPVPDLVNQKGKTLEVQPLGWSADEKRFALRVYEMTEPFGDGDLPPACKGYVDHTGKKFHGGLSFVLYEGSQRVGGWRIQDEKACTPPDKARERLEQAKAALAAQGIDFTAPGATLAADPAKQPTQRTQGKKTEFRLTTGFTLPHGPWAGKKLEAESFVEHREVTQKGEEGEEPMSFLRGRGTVKLRLGSGQGATVLGETALGPDDQDPGLSWVWSAGFDRALLSPSGKVLVALAYVQHGDMRWNGKPRVLFAVVDLAQKLGGAAPPSAPAR